MEKSERGFEQAIDRFADRVLMRTRSGTGVTVYKHTDGSWGFLPHPEDVAASRTVPGLVSFTIACSRCKRRFTVCTISNNTRVSTPCLCTAAVEVPGGRRQLERVFEPPEIDIDYFSASVRDEVVALGGWGLHGMIRGYVASFWATIGKRPDAALWARFFTAATRTKQPVAR
jgi:hypothetical protein